MQRVLIRYLLGHFTTCDTCWVIFAGILEHSGWQGLFRRLDDEKAARHLPAKGVYATALHLAGCKACYIFFDQIRSHAGIPQREIHRHIKPVGAKPTEP